MNEFKNTIRIKLRKYIKFTSVKLANKTFNIIVKNNI
jgi:hypothetical protein